MATSPQSPPTFEAALAELEGIVASMESAQLPLKESLAAYKRVVAPGPGSAELVDQRG